GVPHGRGQSPPRVQGRPRCHRGALARLQGLLLSGLPGAGLAPLRSRCHRRAGASRALHLLRRAHDGRGVCLLPAGGEGPRRPGPTVRGSLRGAAAAPGPWGRMTRTFAPGDRALVLDSKGRRYLLTLSPGAEFHTHAGFVRHDDVLGSQEGTVVRSTTGGRYVVVRPTLAEFVLKMPRGAQVIYPKDLGPILMLADVFPGARVLEAGVGSGALSMTLLRAGAELTGYELRPDFASRARANVEGFLGPDAAERFRVEHRDVYEGVDATGLDRVVLDVPEPWRVVKHAEGALRPGGILVAYLPTIG